MPRYQQPPALPPALGAPTAPTIRTYSSKEIRTLIPFEQLSSEQQQWIRDNNLYETYLKALAEGNPDVYLTSQAYIIVKEAKDRLNELKPYISNVEFNNLTQLLSQSIQNQDFSPFYDRYNTIVSQTPVVGSTSGWSGILVGVDKDKWRGPGQPTFTAPPPMVHISQKELVSTAWSSLSTEDQATITKLGLKETFNDAVLQQRPELINDAINNVYLRRETKYADIGEKYGGGLTLVGQMFRPEVIGALLTEFNAKVNLAIAQATGDTTDMERYYQEAYNAQEARFATQGRVISGFNDALSSNDWARVINFMRPEIVAITTVATSYLSSAGISWFATKLTPLVKSYLTAKGITTIAKLKPMTWINIATYGALAAGVSYVVVPQLQTLYKYTQELDKLNKQHQKDISTITDENKKYSLTLEYNVKKQLYEQQINISLGNLFVTGFTVALALKYGFKGAQLGNAIATRKPPKVLLTAKQTPTEQILTAQRYTFGFRGKAYGRYGSTETISRPTPLSPSPTSPYAIIPRTTPIVPYKPPVATSTPVTSKPYSFAISGISPVKVTFDEYGTTIKKYGKTFYETSYDRMHPKTEGIYWEPTPSVPFFRSLSTKVLPKPTTYKYPGKLAIYEQPLPFYTPEQQRFFDVFSSKRMQWQPKTGISLQKTSKIEWKPTVYKDIFPPKKFKPQPFIRTTKVDIDELGNITIKKYGKTYYETSKPTIKQEGIYWELTPSIPIRRALSTTVFPKPTLYKRPGKLVLYEEKLPFLAYTETGQYAFGHYIKILSRPKTRIFKLKDIIKPEPISQTVSIGGGRQQTITILKKPVLKTQTQLKTQTTTQQLQQAQQQALQLKSTLNSIQAKLSKSKLTSQQKQVLLKQLQQTQLQYQQQLQLVLTLQAQAQTKTQTKAQTSVLLFQPMTATTQLHKPIQIQQQAQAQAQLQRQDLLSLQATELLTLQETVQKTTPLQPSEEELKRKGKTGYNVYVKKDATKPNKRWVQINTQPLERKSALGCGAKHTDNTASRSFQIKPNKLPGVSVNSFTSFWNNHSHQYYKKKDTYIEKTKYAISSPGEKQEITFAPRYKPRTYKPKKMII